MFVDPLSVTGLPWGTVDLTSHTLTLGPESVKIPKGRPLRLLQNPWCPKYRQEINRKVNRSSSFKKLYEKDK